jgi:hypothetical protein
MKLVLHRFAMSRLVGRCLLAKDNIAPGTHNERDQISPPDSGCKTFFKSRLATATGTAFYLILVGVGLVTADSSGQQSDCKNRHGHKQIS